MAFLPNSRHESVLKAKMQDTEKFRVDPAERNGTLFTYNGIAPKAAADSASTWDIVRIEFYPDPDTGEAAQFKESQLIRGAVWNDRATLGWS